MGYMIIPGHLAERYDEVMGKYSCTVPVLEQYVLSEFISSGNFERHLNRVRRKRSRQP
jgi:GntR family transcriptional regulator/MocR family aminotransferase